MWIQIVVLCIKVNTLYLVQSSELIDAMVQGQCFRVASLILKKNLLIICLPEGQRDNHHRYLKDIHITQQTRTKGGPHYDWSVLSTYSLYFRKLLRSIAILHFVSIMGLVSVKWTLSLCKATQCNDLILQSIKGCTVDPTEYILNYDIYSWILSREGFYPRPVMAFGYCHRLRLSVCVRVDVCVCVRQSSVCLDDNLSLVQATITKIGPQV